ncbi:hypothetical protein SAMN02745146_1581 [Hymenobacter daecheongensis DSM 21074]|uniref:Lipoprotein n=1 Tax=Hymenobacter daecheongensis DSM 21074 TaxID=1121955 RepID=A0A1M6E779_9BACT|nr:hypothetical protein [Hymenobacter daecheongensis]SHI81210.1 hypothetical protein SAMN02745146_1581 [Hymenobacter daecheongensis DSM 21074]
MRFSFSLLSLAALAAISACDSTRETTSGQPNPTASRTPAAAAPERPGFRKTLTSGSYTYTISTSGPVGQRQLAVRAEQAGQELTTAQDTIAGEVQDAQLARLTTGPGDELLVFVEGIGSGSYGEVRGYWFGGQDWERMEPLPKLAGPAARGYQGQDKFRVQGRELVRTFPIYLPTDANCCPSGGTRIIRYVLPESSLAFRQASVVNEAPVAQ